MMQEPVHYLVSKKSKYHQMDNHEMVMYWLSLFHKELS